MICMLELMFDATGTSPNALAGRFEDKPPTNLGGAPLWNSKVWMTPPAGSNIPAVPPANFDPTQYVWDVSGGDSNNNTLQVNLNNTPTVYLGVFFRACYYNASTQTWSPTGTSNVATITPGVLFSRKGNTAPTSSPIVVPGANGSINNPIIGSSAISFPAGSAGYFFNLGQISSGIFSPQKGPNLKTWKYLFLSSLSLANNATPAATLAQYVHDPELDVQM